MPFKLGCKPPNSNKVANTLRMAMYLQPVNLPPPPSETHWADKLSQPYEFNLNDQLGDCTVAGMANGVRLITAVATQEAAITDQDDLTAYIGVTGSEGAAYDPATGANDNGATCIGALDYWRTQGIAGHYLDAYLAFTPSSLNQWKQAISLFGFAYLGVALPLSAQGATEWTVPQHVPWMQRHQWAPGGWGGHCVSAVDYNSTGPIVRTWNLLLQATWDWMYAYCQEAYVPYLREWVAGPNGISPSQLDENSLLTDLQAVTQTV